MQSSQDLKYIPHNLVYTRIFLLSSTIGKVSYFLCALTVNGDIDHLLFVLLQQKAIILNTIWEKRVYTDMQSGLSFFFLSHSTWESFHKQKHLTIKEVNYILKRHTKVFTNKLCVLTYIFFIKVLELNYTRLFRKYIYAYILLPVCFENNHKTRRVQQSCCLRLKRSH